MKVVCVNRDSRPSHFLVNFSQNFLVRAEVDLILDFLDETHSLQSVDDVDLSDGSVVNNVLDGEGLATDGLDVLNNFLCPERKVALSSQIRKWFFWGSDPLLDFAQFVTHVDQEFSISLSLVERQCEDATQIVAFCEVLVFTEVAYNVESTFVFFGQYVEQKWHNCVKQEFVIQEQLGEVAQIFTVGWIFVAINLEHSELSFLIYINLVSRWVNQCALLHVIS